MTAAVPYSLTFALLISAFMQRRASKKLQGSSLEFEAKFSLYSSYVCFFLAAAALALGSFLP